MLGIISSEKQIKRVFKPNTGKLEKGPWAGRHGIKILEESEMFVVSQILPSLSTNDVENPRHRYAWPEPTRTRQQKCPPPKMI